MAAGTNFEGLTLANVSRGELEGHFQEGLAEALEVFGRAHDGIYQPSKDKELTVELHFSVVLNHQVDSGTTVVSGGLTKIKRPARKRRGVQAFVSAGAVLVEKTTQADLFPGRKEG